MHYHDAFLSAAERIADNACPLLFCHDQAVHSQQTVQVDRKSNTCLLENAGQLSEDEELRAQIKGSGIGTSATRAEILKKLVNNKYLDLNQKTQIITPTLLGEMIFDVVAASIKSLLNPELTASWEKGLTYVAEGSITSEEYMTKLNSFITSRTRGVMGLRNQYMVKDAFDRVSVFYQKKGGSRKKKEDA